MRAISKIFEPKRKQVIWDCNKLHNEKLMTCTSHQTLLWWLDLQEWEPQATWHVRGSRKENKCVVLVGNLEETAWKTQVYMEEY